MPVNRTGKKIIKETTSILRAVKIAAAHTADIFLKFSCGEDSASSIPNPGVYQWNWGNRDIMVEYPGNSEMEFGSEYSHFSRTFI